MKLMGTRPTTVTPASNNSVEALIKNLEAANLRCAKSEELLRACMGKLGLKLEHKKDDGLQLSVLHISSITPSNAQKLKDSWHDLIIPRDQAEYIVDMKDTFRIETVTTETSVKMNEKSNESLAAFDPSRQSDLSIFVHVQDHPTHEETPFFDHNEFYSGLRQHQSTSPQQLDGFGSYIMYGQVMTSTNTILEKWETSIFNWDATVN
jgi:biotin--protein ligase